LREFFRDGRIAVSKIGDSEAPLPVPCPLQKNDDKKLDTKGRLTDGVAPLFLQYSLSG